MEYVSITQVDPAEIRIIAKRFWTKDGKRVTLPPQTPPNAFNSAVQQSRTKHERMGSVKLAPPPRRLYAGSDTRVDRPTLKWLEAFAKEMGWTPTRAGCRVAGDTALIFAVRNGRHLRPDTKQRLSAKMEELRQCREHSSGKATPTPS